MFKQKQKLNDISLPSIVIINCTIALRIKCIWIICYASYYFCLLYLYNKLFLACAI